jgi:sugar phosphate isomerase/epimerase
VTYVRPSDIFLATIALEPNRHAPGKQPSILVSEWAERILRAGFDGLELWENHALLRPTEEILALRASVLPVRLLNTYVEFTDDQEPARLRVAALVQQLGASGVKYNFGSQPQRQQEYLRNVKRFAQQLPPDTRLLCECHHGTIAEDPVAAERLLKELGSPSRFQAIVHTRTEGSALRKWFTHLGERITHLHVFLPAPSRRLDEKGGESSFRTIAEYGYDKSLSIEFVDPMNAPGETAPLLFDKIVADLQWLRETLAKDLRGTKG